VNLEFGYGAIAYQRSIRSGKALGERVPGLKSSAILLQRCAQPRHVPRAHRSRSTRRQITLMLCTPGWPPVPLPSKRNHQAGQVCLRGNCCTSAAASCAAQYTCLETPPFGSTSGTASALRRVKALKRSASWQPALITQQAADSSARATLLGNEWPHSRCCVQQQDQLIAIRSRCAQLSFSAFCGHCCGAQLSSQCVLLTRELRWGRAAVSARPLPALRCCCEYLGQRWRRPLRRCAEQYCAYSCQLLAELRQ
jgi:hypothetical protein